MIQPSFISMDLAVHVDIDGDVMGNELFIILVFVDVIVINIKVY